MSDKLAEYELVAPTTCRGALVSREQRLALPSFERAPIVPNIPAEDIYMFAAVISNQNLDSYFTKMAESSLRNYAKDATEGVAFLAGHDHRDLPLGYSVDGQLDLSTMSVMADFYTVRGIQVNKVNTDQFIKAVEANLIRDVSIGFKDGLDFAYTCSVCGLSMWDWDCIHIPGVTYDTVTNPEADPALQQTIQELCFAWVQNANLSEVSAVFDGATPGAMLTKATREQRAGRLKPDVQRMLEATYRIHLPAQRTIVTVPPTKSTDITIIEEQTMPIKDESTTDTLDVGALEERRNTELRLQARLVGIDVADTDDTSAIFDKVRAELERLRPFEAQAHDGKVLRTALITETLAEGVRAFGNDFNREAKEKMLEVMPVDAIRELRDAWKETGDAIFANQSRKSTDDPSSHETEPDSSVPEDATGGV